MTPFEATQYWDWRYRRGGTSGAGSRGREAMEKVELVQKIIHDLGIHSVLDLGCGDGYVASFLEVDTYVGFDISEHALQECRALMPERRFVGRLPEGERFDLTLSLDVMFHLVDDADYIKHLLALASFSDCAAFVYGTNRPHPGPEAAHVKHRRWTDAWPMEGWNMAVIPSIHKGAWLMTREARG